MTGKPGGAVGDGEWGREETGRREGRRNCTGDVIDERIS